MPLCPADFDSRQVSSLIQPNGTLPIQAVRRRELFTSHAVLTSAVGAICAQVFAATGDIPGIRSFQPPRCHSRALLQSYFLGFMTMVPCSPWRNGRVFTLNMAALTALRLYPGTTRFSSHSRPPCPSRVTTLAFRFRYRPASLVPRAFGIWPIQAHHLVENGLTALHNLGLPPDSLCSWSPNRTGAFPSHTALQCEQAKRHHRWLGDGYRLAIRACSRSKRQGYDSE
jgi:hypothetical protein